MTPTATRSHRKEPGRRRDPAHACSPGQRRAQAARNPSSGGKQAATPCTSWQSDAEVDLLATTVWTSLRPAA